MKHPTSKRSAAMQSSAGKRQQVVRDAGELLSQRKDAEALALLNQQPKRVQSDPAALYLRAIAHERLRRIDAALTDAQASLAGREHPDTVLCLARLRRARGETDEVLRLCDHAERLGADRMALAVTRGGALEDAGRFDEASSILEPWVERAASRGEMLPTPIAMEWCKVLVQKKRHTEAIALIDDLDQQPLPEPARAPLLHLRAKACDREARFEEAAATAERANAIGKVDFDPDLYTEQVSALIENWGPKSVAGFPLSSCESELPVFVAGMPRSGTSLIDQIIDAHPKASGVGELNTVERFALKLSQAFDPEKPAGKQFGNMDAFRWTRAAKAYIKEVEALAPPGTERIVNKALGNNKLVGLLARLFPRTRVIHAIRDPRDVAVSCFMGGFNNRLHAWTTQVDWVAAAWEQSMRMMEHWKRTLDVPILDVHYERLVAEPETEMPRIIEFLGLEWDDACREFYKTRRTVRTLSYDQVNRPLYTSSSGRHKNYPMLLEGVEFPAYEPFATAR